MNLIHYTGENGLRLNKYNYHYWNWKWDNSPCIPDDITIVDMRPLWGCRGAMSGDHDRMISTANIDYMIVNSNTAYREGEYSFIPRSEECKIVVAGYDTEQVKRLLVDYSVDVVLVSTPNANTTLGEIARVGTYKPVWLDFGVGYTPESMFHLSQHKFITHKLSTVVAESSSNDQLIGAYVVLNDDASAKRYAFSRMKETASKIITKYNQYMAETMANSMLPTTFDKFCKGDV